MTDDSPAVWRLRSDADLLAAAQRLSAYTEKVGHIIRVELGRRGLPEPPLSIATCGRCGRRVYLTASQRHCAYCWPIDKV